MGDRVFAGGEELAGTAPADVGLQRDLVAVQVALARLPGGEGHWTEALAAAEALQRAGKLAPMDAGLVEAVRAKSARLEPGR